MTSKYITESAAEAKPDVTIFFPVYNDERTVQQVVEKSLAVLRDVANRHEVLIIDDGSPDRSGEIADELAQLHESVRVIHHRSNRGYGAAIKTGLENSKYEWICFTDGDDEYDVADLRNLLVLKDFYDLIVTFRYVRLYSSTRILISRVYNALVRFLFRTKFRDISTGLRLIRKSVVERIELTSTSPFIGAEITIKLMLMGYRVGEVGIQTFPRKFGRGESVTPANIIATIRDLFRIHRRVFSDDYRLPPGRNR